jgi:hypothetical protein
MPSRDLYDQIVEACDLSEVIGPGLVRRALADGGGGDPETADVERWRQVLPQLEKRLRAYLTEPEAAGRRRHVEAVLDAWTANDPAVLPPHQAPRAGPEAISTPNPDA